MTAICSKIIYSVSGTRREASNNYPHVGCIAFVLRLQLDGTFIDKNISAFKDASYHNLVERLERYPAANNPLGEKLAANTDSNAAHLFSNSIQRHVVGELLGDDFSKQAVICLAFG